MVSAVQVLTAVVGLLIMFTTLGRLSRRTAFMARFITAVIAMCAVSSYGVIASIVLRLLGKGSLSQWTTARGFSLLLRPLVNIRFELEGEERLLTRPAVFISNHQSELDIYALGRLFPKHCSVTAKKQLKHMPFLGWFMSLSGTVFIDRANSANAKASFAGAVAQMKANKQSVWIFPEGTRSYTLNPDMLPFKKGCFHLALQAGVPIVPVVIQNYSNLFSWKKGVFRGGVIKVKVLEPVDLKGVTTAELDKVVTDVREKMLKELAALHPSPNSIQSSSPSQITDDLTPTTVQK
ncbi:1-acylglycerol-3-phosphate O-acyltransferase [Savitreella phatthalungensis]